MISVIARIPVKPGTRETALDAVKALMAKVAKEEGTLHYTVNIDQNNPDTLVFMERYKDMAALGFHGSTPYFQEFMQKSGSFVAGPPEIVVLDEIHSI
ncbi:MAG: antibiotic biosynthesis monooxygenase [Candidatus Abyssobacteria bacterium SURF_17]|jgi:quinol monooxygenase YgiN|uniref:Antibiotic biosynthesis monooxygenase n=1 Tax=Candidatus Abyssobacteria bacterium SURF_17 TaxID=2093361 RepID=A0A419EP37_9BACT|nr:MAG: antibiotic biosynthesis monooxygenase [Candidatus Abyssubacteria bacterium SURF_17]